MSARRLKRKLAAMWRNKAVTDTYSPGSVFKICVASMALEENKVNDKSTFSCTGSMTFGKDIIHCHLHSGHGTQNFVQAICNSCKPRVYSDRSACRMNKFCQYYESFGFREKTGIDLPGETTGKSGIMI